MYVDAIRRHGLAGPIQLRVEGLPPGITAEISQISAGRNDGILLLHASDDAQPWTGSIRIVGEAKIGDRAIQRVARNAVLLADTGDVQNTRPRSRLTHSLVLAVLDQDPAPIAVSLNERVIETSRGAKIEIPVTYRKATTVKGELTLAAIVGSNEIKPKDVKLAADANDAKLELALNSDKVPLGKHTFFMRGKVKVDYARNSQAIERAEQARKEFDSVVAELADQEGKFTAELAATQQVVAERSGQLKRFDGVRQAAGTALATAFEAANAAAEQVKAFHDVASVSGNDPEIADVVNRAQVAASQSVGQLQAAKEALDQVSKRLSEVAVELEQAQGEVARVERLRNEVAEKRKRAETSNRRSTNAWKRARRIWVRKK